ncbi:type II toxin-antitoxin system ParD family antitoxin [Citrobacter amalonaticus]|uniref:ribbon-helix-helix domain-containing protein n=1 Tax=Citrobacter farmeri TaxID=67824 RepID=UPI00050E03AC|nr:type II toxin-antitoxin system ParD family antitoxin [Citrobacter farmeri]MDB2166954.1 type II toxin-antitoxin system ParD family antitoxin [Citrobacter farmeri]GAL51784.1 hypothetical protein CIFAM_22_00540 [Citrobacter farmeri GTC 1319]
MIRTMTVYLDDELWGFIESLIKSDNYSTQSEVIRESLRLLREKQTVSHLLRKKKAVSGLLREKQALSRLLREKQAESRLQTLRVLLSSDEPRGLKKRRIPEKKIKAVIRAAGETVKLTPEASQDLENIWYYG